MLQGKYNYSITIRKEVFSSSEHALHFGTGSETVISKVEIIFPSSKKITLQNVQADQVLAIYESDAKTTGATIAASSKNKFTDISKAGKLTYTQKENDFIDFKREPLIPYKCSRKGPYYAKADVNGDKLEDLFIGGAAGTEGKLMLQNANGSFTEKKQAVFTAAKNQEDMSALCVDADGDGEMDLYVVSGGAEFSPGNTLYQDRLYKNDGKGNFTTAANALPVEGFNGSSVTALDFDGDGDMDLFVGGHVVPGRFPKADRSMLLQNKGVFTDVTSQYAKPLFNAGIINQAVWADVDGDGKNELSVCGEWMPLEMYSYQDGQFVKKQHLVHIILPSQKIPLSAWML
ncbi:MAG: VCBS repeat-containing protein [Chitinophagaceae bacterium]|nr:VCBS repeat-containing protein [Chitinophagaceae bacterium]